MLRLRVEELLEEKGMTKYRLHQKMQARGGISYSNFNNMIKNRTRSILYKNIELLSDILECDIGDLFEKVEETDEDSAWEAQENAR